MIHFHNFFTLSHPNSQFAIHAFCRICQLSCKVDFKEEGLVHRLHVNLDQSRYICRQIEAAGLRYKEDYIFTLCHVMSQNTAFGCLLLVFVLQKRHFLESLWLSWPDISCGDCEQNHNKTGVVSSLFNKKYAQLYCFSCAHVLDFLTFRTADTETVLSKSLSRTSCHFSKSEIYDLFNTLQTLLWITL